MGLDPTIGAEMQKRRPCVVLSSDAIGRLPVKLVAPITAWNAYAKDALWLVRLDPDAENKLDKIGVVDTLQIRAVDTARCLRKIGVVSAYLMEEIAAAVAAVIEYN